MGMRIYRAVQCKRFFLRTDKREAPTDLKKQKYLFSMWIFFQYLGKLENESSEIESDVNMWKKGGRTITSNPFDSLASHI